MAWKRHLLKTFLKQHKKEKKKKIKKCLLYHSYFQFTSQIWLKNQLVWPTNYYLAFKKYFRSPMYFIFMALVVTYFCLQLIDLVIYNQKFYLVARTQ